GDTPGNGFLKQLEGVIGSHDSSLGPIRGHRALSIPERLQIFFTTNGMMLLLHRASSACTNPDKKPPGEEPGERGAEREGGGPRWPGL
ncbi:hypothetical protein KUCAC02_003546, partial [Chaenocephalus aceratus]